MAHPSPVDLTRPLRYVRYARMSSDKQNPKSPDQQLDQIDDTIRTTGHDNWHHVGDYRDDAVSGQYMHQRVQFNKMVQDIMIGRIVVDAILVDSIERLGRSQELGALCDKLYRRQGVIVLSAENRFMNPKDMAGRLLRTIETTRAESDRHVKAHNINRAKKYQVRHGFWPGGPVPIGYKLGPVTEDNGVKGRKLVPDKQTQWIVARLYKLAHQTGHGETLLAQTINADPAVQRAWGRPLHANTIGRILNNPLYAGELHYNRHWTDIHEDHRTVRRHDENDIIVVKDFCAPLVNPQLAEQVRAMRRRRSEMITKGRKRKSAKHADKQIQAPAPGIPLKYALRGLMRCGVCGASMAIARSGPRRKKSLHVRCPNRASHRCSNKVNVRYEQVWKVVIAQLRRRLFPPPDQSGQAPAWFGPLIQQVRAHLAQLQEQASAGKDDALAAEVRTIQQTLDGWKQSLGDPELDHQLRQEMQGWYQQNKQRLEQIQAEQQQLETYRQHLDELLDPQRVPEALHELDAVLATTNAARTNTVLSRHLDRIEVHGDGRIVMWTCKLGWCAGAVDLLSELTTKSEAQSSDENVTRVRPRRRPKMADVHWPELLVDRPQVTDTLDLSDPRRFAHLAGQWFWEDTLPIDTGRPTCWAREHAQAVLKVAQQHPEWNQSRLAEHFGKSRPTIRHALRIARGEEHPRQPRTSRPHGPRAADIAEQAYELYNVGGKKIAQIATILGVTRNTASQALNIAYAHRGEKRPDGRKVAAQRRVKPEHEKKAAKLEPRVMELFHAGWLYDKIAEELDTHRDTVSKIVRHWHERHGKTPPDGRNRRRHLPRKSRSKNATNQQDDQTHEERAA